MSTKAFIGYISIRCENFYILATRWLSAPFMALGLLNLILSSQIIRKVLFHILLHLNYNGANVQKHFW